MKKFILMFLLAVCACNAPAFAGWGPMMTPRSVVKRVATNEADINKHDALIETGKAKTNQALIKSAENEGRVAQAESDIAEIKDNPTGEAGVVRKVYAGGQLIGTMNKIKGGPGWADIPVKFNDSFDEARITGAGLIFNSPENATFFYKLPDCQGNAYIPHAGTEFNVSPPKGRVMADSDTLHYYPPKPVNMYRMAALSIKEVGVLAEPQIPCANLISPWNGDYLKLLPNNPAITGIYEFPFPLPFTVEGLSPLVIIEE